MVVLLFLQVLALNLPPDPEQLILVLSRDFDQF